MNSMTSSTAAVNTPRARNAGGNHDHGQCSPVPSSPKGAPIKFGFRPESGNIVLEVFNKLGNDCSFCGRKVKDEDTVLEGGDLKCIDCFLNGSSTYFEKKRVPAPSTSSVVGEVRNQYEHAGRAVEQTIDLDGKEYVLEVQIRRRKSRKLGLALR